MAAWTPADISTDVWLDASDPSTIVKFIGTDFVNNWNDKTGKDIGPTQSVSTRGPLVVSSAQNGLDILQFDGVDDILRRQNVDVLQNATSAMVFTVERWPVAPSTAKKVIVEVRHNNNIVANQSRASTVSFLATNSPARGIVAASGSGTDGSASTLIKTLTDTYAANYEVRMGFFDYAGQKVGSWTNGVQRTNTTTGDGSSTSNLVSRYLTVGGSIYSGFTNGTLFSRVNIGEVIIIKNDISTDTRQKIEGYLSWKWGLEGALPGGHPYQFGPPQTGSGVEVFAADTGPLGQPSVLATVQVSSWASDGSLLGAPHVKTRSHSALMSVPSMLQSTSVRSRFDFTPILTGTEPEIYIMVLTTPGGEVRVPISSWQATLQTGSDNSCQCVIPAAFDWMEYIADATVFSIYRTVALWGQEYAELMSSSTLELAQFTQSSSGIICTLTGHSDGYEEDLDPEAVYDRVLTGVQTISRGSGIRVRCDIDFLLRPGQRAFAGDFSMVVGRIGYYVTKGIAYMDVWEAE